VPVRTQGRAPSQPFWKRAPRPLLALGIYVVGVAAVAFIGRNYAPELVRDAPHLFPLVHVLTRASPAFSFGLQLVAAVALLFLPLRVLPATIEQIVLRPRSYRPLPPNDVVVEDVSSSEPIVAWRVWSLSGDTLRGHHGKLWLDRVLDAECPRCLEVPGVGCSCGIYASKGGGADPPRWVEPDNSSIPGRVELSGIVIEHELGYRAQRARILELWAPDFWTAAALERRYGCLVHTLK
jgi:hypothetical protein